MLCHISCSSFYVILFIYVIFVCLSSACVLCHISCLSFYVILFIYVIFVCLSRHVCCAIFHVCHFMSYCSYMSYLCV